MATLNATELTSMLGQRITFTTVFQMDYGPDYATVSGDVQAVLVPAPGSGVGGSLLVLQDGFQEPEFFHLVDIRLPPCSAGVVKGSVSRS